MDRPAESRAAARRRLHQFDVEVQTVIFTSFGHELHRRRRQLTASAGEPSMRGEELQQQGKTQLGRRALARHPLQIVADQRPPLDQLVLIQLPRHPRTLPGTQIGPNGGR